MLAIAAQRAVASSSRLPPIVRSTLSLVSSNSPGKRSERRAGSGRNHATRRSFHASSSRPDTLKDPYKTLGMSKGASASEIKKAYFDLAKKYHPDTNKDKGASEKFVDIQSAYDILRDDKKRQMYDQYGSASQQPGFDPNAFGQGQNPFAGAGGFSGFQDFTAAFGGGQGADLLDQLFGGGFTGRGGRRNAGPTRGDDIETSVNVSFLDACKGTTRNLNVSTVTECRTCSGSGLKSGAKRSTCSTCGGTGSRTHVIASGFHMASTCTACQGTGKSIPPNSQCRDCSGIGRVRDRKTVTVDIPAGVEDGMRVNVPQAGDAPVSGRGPAGDLLVRVNIAPSKLFRRQGVNIYYDSRVPFHTALLGGRVRVPTLDGDVEVRIPAGTQQGEEYVLKNRGVKPVFGGEKGDFFVSFQVTMPRSLTPKQRVFLQQYADDVEGRTSSTSSQPNTASDDSMRVSSRRSDSTDSAKQSFDDGAQTRDQRADIEDATRTSAEDAVAASEETEAATSADEVRRKKKARVVG